MNRWTGVLSVPANPAGASPFFTVAASLLLSPSSKTLSVPLVNAVFFNGDRVEGTGNPVVERLSDPVNIAEILVSKLGSSANAWVVGASAFNGPFAVYREFVPSVDFYGDPKCYDHRGFPALTCLAAILAKCVEELKNLIPNCLPPDVHSPKFPSPLPKTVILGFSKGGTVVNQILTELAYLAPESARISNNSGNPTHGVSYGISSRICPISKEGFLSSISEFHYVDVGLNCAGAYLNNENIIKQAVEHLLFNHGAIRFILHGTPRQWLDKRRPWIRKEKDTLLQLLKEKVPESEGRLHAFERFYFSDMPTSMQMHFRIIEELDLS